MFQQLADIYSDSQLTLLVTITNLTRDQTNRWE